MNVHENNELAPTVFFVCDYDNIYNISDLTEMRKLTNKKRLHLFVV